MKKQFEPAELLGEDGHLSDEGIAFWVDSMARGHMPQVPSVLMDHLDECMYCKSRILELEETLEHLNVIQKSDSTRIERRSGIPKNGWFIAAASFLILISLGWIILSTINRSSDPETLFEEYFEPYPDIVTSKNKNAQHSELFLVGLSYYNRALYDTAMIIFKNVPEAENQGGIVDFYLAQSILAIGSDGGAAISLLKPLTENENIFQDDAMWYLALALMVEKRQKEALIYLDNLTKRRRSYSKKAEELIEKLL